MRGGTVREVQREKQIKNGICRGEKKDIEGLCYVIFFCVLVSVWTHPLLMAD